MASTSGTIEKESHTGSTVIHEVKSVYVYIPAELSATGFELKINGTVQIIRKGPESSLVWDPVELTYSDVACLYSAEADGWTVIDEEPYDPPEVVDSHEIKYPSIYPKLDLTPPDPIVGGAKRSPDRVKYSKGQRNSQGTPSPGSSSPSSFIASSKNSPVCFVLSQLKCVRETTKREKSVMTFFLRNGKELPTLYFHDGGTSGLLQTLQRFLYLVRDGKDTHLIRVEKNPVIEKSRQPKNPVHIETIKHHSSNKGSSIFVPLALDIGKMVRHTLTRPAHDELLDKRPHPPTEEEEEISTITCKEVEKESGQRIKPKPTHTSSSNIDPDASLIADFQIITDLRGRLPPRPPLRPRLPPLSREEWESYRSIDGQITSEKEREFRSRVFAGSIDPSLRREVWKYLLGYFAFDATDIERMEEQKRLEKMYDIMKKQWMSFLEVQETNFCRWRELKNLVEKDVIRTDRDVDMYHSVSSPHLKQLQNILNTYVMYNFDLGYVQGMSDLLSPILAVMENEHDSFWCFVGLMNMIKDRFEVTQENMRLRIRQLRALLNVSDPKFYQYLREKDSSNLYLSFRWLLVDFKRELNFEDLMILWEVFWTRHLSFDYPLFFALAIIDMEKEKMIDPKFDFSDIIAHINGLSKKLPLELLLQKAESICRQIAMVKELPEELQSVVKQPLPV